MCLKKWSALKVFCLFVDTAFAQGCHMLARILSEWLSLPKALMARHSSMPSFWHWSGVWLFPGDKWKPREPVFIQDGSDPLLSSLRPCSTLQKKTISYHRNSLLLESQTHCSFVFWGPFIMGPILVPGDLVSPLFDAFKAASPSC